MQTLMDTYGSMLLDAIGTHMLYVIVSVALGFTVGVLLGILLAFLLMQECFSGRWKNPMLNIDSLAG